MTSRSMVVRSAVSLFLILLTGGIVGWMAIPEEIPKVSVTAVIPTVETVPIQLHESGIDFSIDGEVIPFRRLDLVAEIQGRVIYKSEQCRLGQYVKQDELLLKIDPVDYQLALDQAESAVKQAKVAINENEVQKTNTEKELFLARERHQISEKDYVRSEQLVKESAYVQADLEKAQSAALTTQESVQRLENQLRILESQSEKLNVLYQSEELALKTAKLNLSRTEVRSPITGIVTSDSFEVNSFIQKGANVAKILDTSQLEIQCSLYMRQIQWIWQQTSETTTDYVFAPTPVTIMYETDGERWAWDGILKSLDGGIMNAATRMVPCRVKVDNPQSVKWVSGGFSAHSAQPTLFAGMYVTVIVHSKPSIPLYQIPERALLPGNKIWTVADGKLKQHAIRIAVTTQDRVLFYADPESIRPNDLVVVSPLASPSEGSPVQTIMQVTQYQTP